MRQIRADLSSPRKKQTEGKEITSKFKHAFYKQIMYYDWSTVWQKTVPSLAMAISIRPSLSYSSSTIPAFGGMSGLPKLSR
jgi:hypothetical protein